MGVGVGVCVHNIKLVSFQKGHSVLHPYRDVEQYVCTNASDSHC